MKENGGKVEQGGYRVRGRTLQPEPATCAPWLGATVDALHIIEEARGGTVSPVWSFLYDAGKRLQDEITRWLKVDPGARADFERAVIDGATLHEVDERAHDDHCTCPTCMVRFEAQQNQAIKDEEARAGAHVVTDRAVRILADYNEGVEAGARLACPSCGRLLKSRDKSIAFEAHGATCRDLRRDAADDVARGLR